MLGHLLLKNPAYGRFLVDTYLSLIASYPEQPDIERVVLNFTETCLQNLLQLEANPKRPYVLEIERRKLKHAGKASPSHQTMSDEYLNRKI